MFKGLEKVFDIIGEILAVFLVVLFIVILANANWPFLDKVEWLPKVVHGIFYWGMYALVAVVGLEAMCKRNIVFFILFCAMLAVCIIFLCFPDTYNNLIGMITKK